MEKTTAHGWAVLDAGKRILVDTVSPTRRAAIVNWLTVHGGGAAVMAWDTDDWIEQRWKRERRSAEVAVVRIQQSGDAEH